MNKITVNRNQLSPEGLVFRQEQLPKSSQDKLVANGTDRCKQPKAKRTLLGNLSRAKHSPIDIPVPSDINPDLYNKPTNTKRTEASGKGFGANNSSKKNNKTNIRQKEEEEAPISFPASQSSSYTAYLNEIATQRLASIANNKILYIEDSETIKSNIEANRRLLWRTLVQDPALEKLAKDTLVEYLDARPDNNKLIKFTFPPENQNPNRVLKTVTPKSIEELKNDPDIQMSVLLSKAKTDPEQKITEGLNLKNILQIIDHMAYISAWKDDSTMANYPHNEPELRQVLDFSVRSTQVQENGLLSSEILEEKKDLEGSVIPLEEMFKKPSVINLNNLNKITEAFKLFSDLDLAKGKLLDIYSVPVDPGKPQWLSSTYIRTYTDKEEDSQEECQSVNTNNSFYRIAYMEPLLSDTRRANSIRSGNENENENENEAVSGQKLSAVNNYTSTVVNENIADAQKLLSDLFNPDLYFKQETSLAKTCQSFETQYPSIAQNPLILINDDKYCNSGVIQYLCFNDRFGEASEAVKRAMPKLTNIEDKKFLENILLNVATFHDDIKIKFCVIPQIGSLLKNTPPDTLFTLSRDEALYLKSLYDLIAKKPELNKDLIEYLDKEPRHNSKDCSRISDLVRLFYENQPNQKLLDENLLALIQKLQGEIIYHRLQENFHLEYEKMVKTKSDSIDINLPTANIRHTNLGKRMESLKDIDADNLYYRATFSDRIRKAIKTGEIFTQEEIHQSVKEYYEQGNNYKQK